MSRRMIASAVEGGVLVRIRPGWFATPDAPPDLVRAVRVGGSLTCLSATSHIGLWTPADLDLHVGLRPGDRHRRHPVTAAPIVEPIAGVVVHWTSRHGLLATRGVLPVVDCMLDVLRCQPADVAFAVLESGLRLGVISAAARAELAVRAPYRHAALIASADAQADTGTESLFRFRFAVLGVEMRSQVVVPGVGKVDFVIGDRILVEIDSQAHHGSPSQRRRDLDRDAVAAGLGFVVLRFDYTQIVCDWATVEATVMALIERGEHCSRTRSR